MQLAEAEGNGPLTRKEDITVKTSSSPPEEQLGKGKRWISDPKCQSTVFQTCLRGTRCAPSRYTWVKSAKKASVAFIDLVPHNSGASCTCENSLCALPAQGC